MLKQLTSWLATQLSLTVGTSIFAGFIPAQKADTALALMERSPGMRETDGTEIDRRPVQVYARARDYHTARELAASAINAMVNRGIDLTDDWRVHSATGGPAGYIGLDAEGRHSFSGNVLLYVKQES